jgi:putative heme-binding domain-containing protein
MLVAFSGQPGIQGLLAETATADAANMAAREFALTVMAEAKGRDVPPAWSAAVAAVLSKKDSRLVPLALAAARAWPKSADDASLRKAILGIAERNDSDAAAHVEALAIIAGKLESLSDQQFQMLKTVAIESESVPLRARAADALSQSKLNAEQLRELCEAARNAGPLEVNRLYAPFAKSTDDAIGLLLVSALRESANSSAVRIDLLREALAKYGSEVKNAVDELESVNHADAAAQRKRIDELLPLVKSGDERRGHAVFNSAKAACSSCHRMGYAGGTTGPELSHVGQTRTERDLLESILFPSLSFVRSYEPMLIITQDGKTINGVIRDETAEEYVVATGPDQVVRVPRADVEQMQPSTVSIMPTGLDKQLTTQELMDLVAFLKKTADRK